MPPRLLRTFASLLLSIGAVSSAAPSFRAAASQESPSAAPAGAPPATAQEAPASAWRPAKDGTKIPVLPSDRPRLYLRASHVPELARRLEHPTLKATVEALRADAARNPERAVEWASIQYLITGDRSLGLATVAKTLDLLRVAKLQPIQDACRLTGRTMVTGALVYDWHYHLLTDAQRQAYIKELIRLAHTLECGYPPTRQGSVTGHSSEEMLMRDLLSAGIAIADEFPEMYELAAARFFREHLPARNWLYSGHAYHQGDSYNFVRFGAELYPLWIFDRLGFPGIYNREQREVPYSWIYARRPDGQLLRAGDTFRHSAKRGSPWGPSHAGLYTASYYRDPILYGDFMRSPDIGERNRLFDFLWRDLDLVPQPPDSLPLARHFGGPFGWTIARTGWGDAAAIVEMKVNVYNFVNHQHLDAGAFQIYHRGALALDSGLYQGSSGGYGSPHDANYNKRTIAHNSLLVLDPSEKFPRDRANDGGQRAPGNWGEPKNLEALLDERNGYRTGEVLAHGALPDYRDPDLVYLTGDLTRAYSSKVRQVVRSFVYLNLRDARTPAALVVFDRVVSAKNDFRKTWLLHALQEPALGAAGAAGAPARNPSASLPSAVVDCTEHGQSGRLVLHALLPGPTASSLVKIGGPGREFLVDGKNYPNEPTNKKTGKSAAGSHELGAWRIEISPTTPAAEDCFLNVMLVTNTSVDPASLPPVALLREGGRLGCRIGDRRIWFDAASGRFLP